MDDLVTRLLVHAEGSRRASKQEKDMGEALIHQGRMLALIDAAEYIKVQQTELPGDVGERVKRLRKAAHVNCPWQADPKQLLDWEAADGIEAQRIEMSRAGIAAIKCTDFQNARIKRLKSVVADLLRALDRIKEMAHNSTLGSELGLEWIVQHATVEMKIANDRMKESP